MRAQFYISLFLPLFPCALFLLYFRARSPRAPVPQRIRDFRVARARARVPVGIRGERGAIIHRAERVRV